MSGMTIHTSYNMEAYLGRWTAALKCDLNVHLVAFKVRGIAQEATFLVKCDTDSLSKFSYFLPYIIRPDRYATIPNDTLNRHTGREIEYFDVSMKCLSLNRADVAIIVGLPF